MSAAHRLKVIRYLIGLTATDFAEWMGIPENRYRNIERGTAIVNEKDILLIYQKIPEALIFVISGEPLKTSELIQSKSFLNTIPQRLKDGMKPKFFDPGMVIDDLEEAQP